MTDESVFDMTAKSENDEIMSLKSKADVKLDLINQYMEKNASGT